MLMSKLCCLLGISSAALSMSPGGSLGELRSSIWFLRHSKVSLGEPAAAEQKSLRSAPSWYRSSALSGISLGAWLPAADSGCGARLVSWAARGGVAEQVASVKLVGATHLRLRHLRHRLGQSARHQVAGCSCRQLMAD